MDRDKLHSFPAETADGERVNIIDKRYVNGVLVLTDEDGTKYAANAIGGALTELKDEDLPEGGYTNELVNITTAEGEEGLAVTKDGDVVEVNIPATEMAQQVDGEEGTYVDPDGEKVES